VLHIKREKLLRFPAGPMPLEKFECFPRLPKELRLLIWECTWPDPQVFEPITFMDRNEDSILASIESVAETLDRSNHEFLGDQTLPDFEEAPIQTPPIALHICQESRKHTAATYMHVQQSQLPCGGSRGSIYLSPSRDLFFLRLKWISMQTHLYDIYENYFSEGCAPFRTLMVQIGDNDLASDIGFQELPGIRDETDTRIINAIFNPSLFPNVKEILLLPRGDPKSSTTPGFISKGSQGEPEVG